MTYFVHILTLVVAFGAFSQAKAQKSVGSPESVPESRRGADPLRAPRTGPAETMPSRNAWSCLLEPHLVVSVGSPVDGVLEEVLVDRGDEVRVGQVVARLQSGVESAAVELTRSHIAFGKRKVERNEVLFQKQLISEQERDDMETEVRLREQELKRDLENLKLRTIVSPLNGIVVERRLTKGDLVRADRSVVLRLARIDPLNVEVIAPGESYGAARIGMSGTVSLQPLLPGTFRATVVTVDKLIDAASGTFGIRLQMPNPGNKIPAGLKCSVQLTK
jgi:membrane fusion protein (multidrug efflux system)